MNPNLFNLSRRVFGLGLAASLVLPVAGVVAPVASAQPARMHAASSLAVFAQEAPSQPEVKGGEAKGKESASEENENDKFRHSPTVVWFSKLFGMSVDATATLFEYINFAVIALAVGIPLFRTLPKVFRKRQARLSADIEVAQAKTADANERLSAVETKLKGLDAEIEAIRKQVDEAMRGDEARAKASIEEETARIVAAAELEIKQAGSQAQRGLKQFAADLAVDRALTKISLDAETDRVLIAEFASDIAHGGKSRQTGKARKGENN